MTVYLRCVAFDEAKSSASRNWKMQFVKSKLGGRISCSYRSIQLSTGGIVLLYFRHEWNVKLST